MTYKKFTSLEHLNREVLENFFTFRKHYKGEKFQANGNCLIGNKKPLLPSINKNSGILESSVFRSVFEFPGECSIPVGGSQYFDYYLSTVPKYLPEGFFFRFGKYVRRGNDKFGLGVLMVSRGNGDFEIILETNDSFYASLTFALNWSREDRIAFEPEIKAAEELVVPEKRLGMYSPEDLCKRVNEQFRIITADFAGRKYAHTQPAYFGDLVKNRGLDSVAFSQVHADFSPDIDNIGIDNIPPGNFFMAQVHVRPEKPKKYLGVKIGVGENKDLPLVYFETNDRNYIKNSLYPWRTVE
jgi:hypothetical protein